MKLFEKNFVETMQVVSLIVSMTALLANVITLPLLLSGTIQIANWVHMVIIVGLLMAPIGVVLGLYRIDITVDSKLLKPKSMVILTGFPLVIYNHLYDTAAMCARIWHEIKTTFLYVYDTYYTEKVSLCIGISQLTMFALLGYQVYFRYDEKLFNLLFAGSMTLFATWTTMLIVHDFHPNESST